jgi:hypothetical protein
VLAYTSSPTNVGEVAEERSDEVGGGGEGAITYPRVFLVLGY